MAEPVKFSISQFGTELSSEQARAAHVQWMVALQGPAKPWSVLRSHELSSFSQHVSIHSSASYTSELKAVEKSPLSARKSQRCRWYCDLPSVACGAVSGCFTLPFELNLESLASCARGMHKIRGVRVSHFKLC
jgi:hypothetical protein